MVDELVSLSDEAFPLVQPVIIPPWRFKNGAPHPPSSWTQGFVSSPGVIFYLYKLAVGEFSEM